MRDPERIPSVLAAVERLWQAYPDWRLGQLLCNVASWVQVDAEFVWNLEDDELMAEIERHLCQRKAYEELAGEDVALAEQGMDDYLRMLSDADRF